MKVQLPCGRGRIPFDIDESRVLSTRVAELSAAGACSSGEKENTSGNAGVITASGQPADAALSGAPRVSRGTQLVQEALAHPIGSPALSELAKGKQSAVVIISDHTRPVPSRDILPAMLEELRKGNPEIRITLLAATGCHRETTGDELRAKLGDELFKKEQIVVHDAFDVSRNTDIGVLPSGAHLVLDHLAVEADLLVAEGFIEPHFFAGYSGGRKSVLPGICDRVTVYGNHCSRFIDDPHCRTGILEGNPIHEDMIAAARMAKLAFIVNVIVDAEHQTVAAFAGAPEAAHAAGVSFLEPYCRVAPVPGDIVVTTNGGYPLDQNLYQCVKGLTAAEASAKPGAVLILCAGLADGMGGDRFYQDMKNCKSPAALYDEYMQVPQDRTAPDQWQTQILCRILKKHRVIFVTIPEMRTPIEEMKMFYAATLPEAVETAKRFLAEDGTVTAREEAEITVIPDGVSICVC